jgi:thioredoxin 1
MVAPVVEELAGEYVGKVRFTKLNTDDNVNTAMGYGIRGIPTMIIFSGGKEVGRIVGFVPKPELKKRLDAALASVPQPVK